MCILVIIGNDASEDTPFVKSVQFEDPVSASKRMVNILRKKEKVALVICPSHSGTYRTEVNRKESNISDGLIA